MTGGSGKLQATVRLIVRTVIVIVLVVLVVMAIYLTAAATGTVWTARSDRTPGSGGTNTIFVLSNGFHSDIALPVKDGLAPHGLPVLASDLPGGLRDTRYLIVGWGSQTAYTSLLALSDLTAGIIVKALAFDRSVVHVLPSSGTPRGEGVYRLDLDDTQYERLIDFIAGTFEIKGNGQVELLHGVTQGFGDVFYRAIPRFSVFYGCNAWTGQALREAGVPVGYWTPFAQSIEWNMNRLPAPD